MTQARYKIVFNGELMPDASLEATQENLARLFKSDLTRIHSLFIGKAIDLKRDLSENEADQYLKALQSAGLIESGKSGRFIRYRASKFDCDACALKPKCCPVTPMRKIMRSIHEGARDLARNIATTDAYLVSRRQRKKVEMLFAHLKRILRMDRLRLRGPNGARDEFLLAATAQNLRKMAKLIPIPATLATA